MRIHRSPSRQTQPISRRPIHIPPSVFMHFPRLLNDNSGFLNSLSWWRLYCPLICLNPLLVWWLRILEPFRKWSFKTSHLPNDFLFGISNQKLFTIFHCFPFIVLTIEMIAYIVDCTEAADSFGNNERGFRRISTLVLWALGQSV